jgi:hypothetical protein
MKRWPGLFAGASLASAAHALDGNGHARSDVWEMVFGAAGIREALARIGPGSWDWHENRLKLAIYLIVCSPEFAVQH